ncbi:MAG: hypothetical protein AAFQ53_17990, partial [Bacteroidota bacterium]
MSDRDSDVPLADPGLGERLAEGRAAGLEWPRRALTLAAVPVLLFVGGVLGLYVQGPGLRAFFSVSG